MSRTRQALLYLRFNSKSSKILKGVLKKCDVNFSTTQSKKMLKAWVGFVMTSKAEKIKLLSAVNFFEKTILGRVVEMLARNVRYMKKLRRALNHAFKSRLTKSFTLLKGYRAYRMKKRERIINAEEFWREKEGRGAIGKLKRSCDARRRGREDELFAESYRMKKCGKESFKKLTMNVKSQLKKHKLMQKCLFHMRTTLLQKVFNCFTKYVRSQFRSRKMYEEADLLFEHSASCRFLRNLRLISIQKSHSRLAFKRAATHRNAFVCRKHLRRYTSFWCERKNTRKMTKVCLELFSSHLHKIAFNGWRR